MRDIEGVLLTGGASRRMGADKASILVEGQPLVLRIAKALAQRCEKVTVLGREPVNGYAFLEDQQEYAGPIAALSRFEPSSEFFFLASCDLPAFDARLIDELRLRIERHQAAIPVWAGRPQPLCALYCSPSLDDLRSLARAGERRVMAWTAALDAVMLNAEELPYGWACQGVNTPEELRSLQRHPEP